jgi:hypothetical protein
MRLSNRIETSTIQLFNLLVICHLQGPKHSDIARLKVVRGVWQATEADEE